MMLSRGQRNGYKQSAIKNGMNIENIVMMTMKHFEVNQILALDKYLETIE